MNVNRSLLACGLLILTCLLINLLINRPTSGQQVVSPPAPAGRYQIVVKSGPSNSAVFIFDPTTAECWYRDTNPAVTEWTTMGSPVIKPKR